MKLKSLILGSLLSLLLISHVAAQGVGQLGAGQVWGNPNASQDVASPASLSQMFNRAFCSTPGGLVQNVAGTWACIMFLPNVNLAQSPSGATFKGNPSASAGSISDFTIQGLPNLASPNATLDFLPCYDHVSGTIKSCTPGGIASSASGVSSFNGLLGAVASRPPGIQNGKIVESHVANTVTFALKTLAGADPSAGDPVFMTAPDYSTTSVTAALAITIPSTGTMGATSAIPFRIWLVLINDAGTMRLGARNASDAVGIYGFPAAGSLTSTTASSSSGITYTQTAVTNKPFSILGYANYDTGLATAGTWNASPTSIVGYLPGMPKPGDVIQSKQTSAATTLTNATTSYVDSALTITGFVLSSPINPVQVTWSADLFAQTSTIAAFAALRRGGSVLGVPYKIFTSGTDETAIVGGSWMDSPGSIGPLTWVVSTKVSGAGSCKLMATDSGGVMQVEELMG